MKVYLVLLILAVNGYFFAPAVLNAQVQSAPLTSQDTLQVPPDSSLVVPSCPDTLVLEMADQSLPADTLQERSVNILCTGDLMPGTNYPSSRYLPPRNDCFALFADAREEIAAADIAAGNLEGVFSDASGHPKTCHDTLNCYVFRMPDSYAACIEEAGYDVLSVANNHVNDFGAAGRAYTTRILDNTSMKYAGFLTHPWTIFEKDGIRYGFAAFAPHTGTMDLKQYAKAAEIVKMLDDSCDIVIVSFHGGAEGKDHQHLVKGDEEFLGYNRGSVYRFAHTVIDAGADVVYGHGPHVVRAMELYKDRLICYSLGNFCTYARFNLSGPNSLAPAVVITTDTDGKFLEGRILSFTQTGEGGPKTDPLGRAARKIRELTLSDLPPQEFEIFDDGAIIRK